MNTKISCRGWIRIISYLCAAFLILFGFLLQKNNETVRYRRSLALVQQHAFSEVATAVSEISAAAEKASYATSASMISTLCTEVYGKAAAAQMSLGELPYANVSLEQTTAFLARVGDYAFALSKSVAANDGWTEEELETWVTLSDTVSNLSDQLTSLQAELDSGALTLESIDEATERLAALTEDADLPGGTMYEDLEDSYDQLPALIYDGPFSQHLENREAAALAGLETITEDEAIRAAAAFFSVPEEKLTVSSELGGTLEGWLITGLYQGVYLSAEVTKTGGQIIQASRTHTAHTRLISAERAVELAEAFLTEQGFDSMTESYYQEEDCILTINFAWEQEGTICYPDLVKVSVALDDGSITGFEAKGYLMNHQTRTIDAPTVTEEAALSCIPDTVEVLSIRYAVIPTDGQYERACLEVKCETEDGRHIIYYLNGETGAEEKIYLLIEDESGTLVV